MKAALLPPTIEMFHENGYAVLRSALSPGEVSDLLAEATSIIRGKRGDVAGIEPAAPGESDDEALARYLCIHFPHKLSPLFHKYLSHPAIVRALTAVIGPNVKAMQSMLFIKPSGKPGQAWHQDEFFIPTRDRSLTAAWIALDNATLDNGCLWVIPGSHKHGVLWPQQEHEDDRFDCAGESFGFPYSDSDAIPVEVEAGSVVLFNGYLLHRSLPNRAPGGYRRALANHYMSAESFLPWMVPQQLAGSGTYDFRDIVLVAGEDPYAYRGTEDLSHAHVRPSGEGGCGNEKNNLKM
ncbi:MAG TPA: phytanoyl-CoA dioxygenase family protein [Actinomycetota bacterium]|nr:phytanoyl-CoA dioxygenase family protein [Actinomycetota bacterium]